MRQCKGGLAVASVIPFTSPTFHYVYHRVLYLSYPQLHYVHICYARAMRSMFI